jgi:hypothetical protein
MPISDELLKYYYSQHDKYSIRTTWHQQHLIENILDIQGFIQSISNNLGETELKEPITSYPLGYFQIEQPSRINYAHMVFLFSILERRIRALVKLTIELKNITKELSDYKGSFLDRVKKFLKENLDIDISTNNAWTNIMTFQKVRDCIIHCGANINESRDHLFLKHLADKNIIELNNNGYMRIGNDFCIGMQSATIEFVSTGLDNLYSKLVELEIEKEKQHRT